MDLDQADFYEKAVAMKLRDMQNFGPRPSEWDDAKFVHWPKPSDRNEPVPNPIGEGKATSEIGDPPAPPFVGVAIICAMCFFVGGLIGLLGAIIF